jgi:hypothetical protein
LSSSRTGRGRSPAKSKVNVAVPYSILQGGRQGSHFAKDVAHQFHAKTPWKVLVRVDGEAEVIEHSSPRLSVLGGRLQGRMWRGAVR